MFSQDCVLTGEVFLSLWLDQSQVYHTWPIITKGANTINQSWRKGKSVHLAQARENAPGVQRKESEPGTKRGENTSGAQHKKPHKSRVTIGFSFVSDW